MESRGDYILLLNDILRALLAIEKLHKDQRSRWFNIEQLLEEIAVAYREQPDSG